MTTIRLATEADLPGIMAIIDEAKEFLHQNGVCQWIDGYPATEDFLVDITQGICHVAESDGKIAGVMAVDLMPDPCYAKIYEGAWLTDGLYAAIHRITVGASYRGLGIARAMFAHAKAIAKDNKVSALRIDTHRDNAPMRGLVTSFGFTYCGIIYLESGSERLAYEMII